MEDSRGVYMALSLYLFKILKYFETSSVYSRLRDSFCSIITEKGRKSLPRKWYLYTNEPSSSGHLFYKFIFFSALRIAARRTSACYYECT